MEQVSPHFVPIWEVLCGYLDDTQRKYSEHPIGESGLTNRVHAISFFQEFARVVDRNVHRRIFTAFRPLLVMTLELAKNAWITEVFRILDAPRTFVGQQNKKVENLTVALCHERFQNCSVIIQADKDKESKLYEALDQKRTSEGFREFRNTQMFHLDFEEAKKKPTPCGDLLAVTSFLVQWYEHVATTIAKGRKPDYVIRGAPDLGRQMARTLRRVLMDAVRWQAVGAQPYRATVCNRYGPCGILLAEWLEAHRKERNSVPGTQNAPEDWIAARYNRSRQGRTT